MTFTTSEIVGALRDKFPEEFSQNDAHGDAAIVAYSDDVWILTYDSEVPE